MGVNTLWDEDVEECWKIGLALAALAPLLPAVASVGLHASLCYRAGTAAAIAVMAAIVCVLLWAGALDTGPWSVLTIILIYMAIGAVYLRKTSHRLMQLSCGERTW